MLVILSRNLRIALALFKEYSQKEEEDSFFIDIKANDKPVKIKGLKEAERYINKYLKEERIILTQLKKRSYRNKRDKLIKELRRESNLSIREIASLLEIDRGMVSRAIK